MVCVECNKNQIFIKKRKLCLSCYQLLRKKGNLIGELTGCKNPNPSYPTMKKYEHLSEINFIKNYFVHNNWVSHPCCFKLNNVSYTPDFYDGVNNCFIEVAGTRQAYHANKEKYVLMKSIFPLINFEVRQSNGNLIDLNDDKRISWGDELSA